MGFKVETPDPQFRFLELSSTFEEGIKAGKGQLP